jgi:hypothetical protein
MQLLSNDECERWRASASPFREYLHQVTCITPLTNLQWFAQAMGDHLLPFDIALLLIDEVVFDLPPALLTIYSPSPNEHWMDKPGLLFGDEKSNLLDMVKAVWSGWMDFRVIFAPAGQAVRADHDEYTTFFSNSLTTIQQLEKTLTTGGVSIVDYTASEP